MTTTIQRLLDAGTVEEVRARRCTVVTGGGHAIAVFPLGDRFAAVDNRCPHMGFPLDRGTVSNGILTCPTGITPGSTSPAAARSTPSPTT